MSKSIKKSICTHKRANIHLCPFSFAQPKFGKLVVNDLLYVQESGAHASVHTNSLLLQYLFSLVVFKEARLLACQLIESILLHMPMLNLSAISNVTHILATIDDEGLSSICRIFAITLSDLDMAEKKCWTQSKQPQPQPQPHGEQQPMQVDGESQVTKPVPLSVRDQNQDLLLNIPGLLGRLVNLVRRKDYTIRYVIGQLAQHNYPYSERNLCLNQRCESITM